MRPMKGVLCPRCVKAGGLCLYMAFQPTNAFSVAGVQMKIQVREVPMLSCSLCKWEVVGFVDGGDAVFPDPHVQAPDQGK